MSDPVSIPDPAVFPLPGMWGQAVRSIITITQPILQNQPSESGGVISVPMVAAYPDEEITASHVRVHIEEGDNGVFGPDDGNMGFLPDLGMFIHEVQTVMARVCFVVYATKDAVRRYIAGLLKLGILTDYSMDPSNIRHDGIIIKRLRAEAGVYPYNRPLFDPLDCPVPDLKSPRVAGLPFMATLKMRADISNIWYTAPAVMPGMVISHTTATNGIPVTQNSVV